ncbi:hypothetical protein HYH03_003405 [Edaphochlamys debaryana]|uniref:Uncharacterized protein n=1 Tax=Edaphochlamys debaryana TaxID=47281 RepID=A0A835YBH2_9CHLO|nr:hypothetical protein HYH03_003405 [Edaphochlamys debaryana]|eukprot:KAG2498659.1 hypothetical protein HYH03_003405 [Edaphochlamys debaryana]
MGEPLVQAASRLAECCALVAIGYNLKQNGILRTSDGETAIKVATTLTLPSVIVQALGTGGPLAGAGFLPLLGVAGICMGAQIAAGWLHVAQRSKRERAVLGGSSSGLGLALWGYPVADCFLGAAGAQVVALVDLLNHVAVWIGSYMLSASAGPAFPASFKHEDGGDYRGQWRGMRKEGLGVYTYASGARYEGEWRNNLKEGRGVYHFPKGGVYEGEWANGSMNGLGVRTMSTGQVKAGRWRDGQLEAPLELWQVALAAEGASTVAAAARGVEVGGGRWQDAAQMLAAQPTLWALVGGLAVNLMRVPLPTSVDLLTGVLATANTPLTLLAAGVTLPLLSREAWDKLLPASVLSDVAALLSARLLLPLTVSAALVGTLLLSGPAAPAAAAAAAAGSAAADAATSAAGSAAADAAAAAVTEAASAAAAAAAGAAGAAWQVPSGALLPLAVMMVALLAPVPLQALANARRFRLNEATAAAMHAASVAVCVPLMLAGAAAAVLAGLAPPPGAAAVAPLADVRPVLAFAAAAAAVVGSALSWARRRADAAAGVRQGGLWQRAEDQRVLMVYVGQPEAAAAAAASTSAAAAAAGPPAASTPGRAGPAAAGPSGTGAGDASSSGSGNGSGGGGSGSGGSAPGAGGGGGSGSGSARSPQPPRALSTDGGSGAAGASALSYKSSCSTRVSDVRYGMAAWRAGAGAGRTGTRCERGRPLAALAAARLDCSPAAVALRGLQRSPGALGRPRAGPGPTLVAAAAGRALRGMGAAAGGVRLVR